MIKQIDREAARRFWPYQGFFEDVCSMIAAESKQRRVTIVRLVVRPEQKLLDVKARRKEKQRIEIAVEVDAPTLQERIALQDLLSQRLKEMEQQEYPVEGDEVQKRGGYGMIRIKVG